MPGDEVGDVFGEDGVVDFLDIARPAEHKRAIAVNAFVRHFHFLRSCGIPWILLTCAALGDVVSDS